VEAPSMNTILPLANFGSVSFAKCNATINAISGAINNKNWKHEALTLKTQEGIAKAEPSVLSDDGTSFTVTWNHE
jgi:hypothetical protein